MRVIEHLLKLQYATEHEPRGRVWWRAVHGARSALDLFATPSLKPKLQGMLPEMYERARELAKCELHDIGQISLAEFHPASVSLRLRADPRRGLVAGLGRSAGGVRLITGRARPSA